MYKIDRLKDRPDAGYLNYKAEQLMKRGIRIADCEKLLQHYNDIKQDLARELNGVYGISNPNSSVQVINYLKSLSESIDISSKNDIVNICFDETSGKWTSKAEVMEKLAELGYEFAVVLLDYRKVKKCCETLDSLSKFRDRSGLIHPTVTVGKTNRINYRDPALMNIPKDLLWYLILPMKDGNVLYSADIKNQEPHILFNMVNSKELKEVLKSPKGIYEELFQKCFRPKVEMNVLVDFLPEERLYSTSELKEMPMVSPVYYSAKKTSSANVTYNGKKVSAIQTFCYGRNKGSKKAIDLPKKVSIELEDGSIVSVKVRWEDYTTLNKDFVINGYLDQLEVGMTQIERSEFKTAWLAMNYGSSLFGVENQCKAISGKAVYKFYHSITELKKYVNQVEKLARSGKSRISTIFGTPLDAGFETNWKKLKRSLLDLPIQGSAADILSLLVKRFYGYTYEHNLSDKMSLYFTRHDELIVEVDGSWLAEVGDKHVEEILMDMLEHQIDDWEPFKLDIEKIEKKDIN